MQQMMAVNVKGHLKIEDDLGNVLVDKDNAVHPQNMARVIARALANESNYFIHRIAYGNGGTTVDAAFQVTFRPPNDGLPPDLQEWRSRLYNETYSEIIDDSNVQIGIDPGSAGPAVGTRPGGGSNPSGDPTTVEHVSGPGVRSQELGLLSQVIITSVLNPGEPAGQLLSDQDPTPGVPGDPVENTEGAFVFDEIGLYTTGADAADSNGLQQIDLGIERDSSANAGLKAGCWYNVKVAIGPAATGSPITYQDVTFQVPLSTAVGSPVVACVSDSSATYGDISEAINTQDPAWGTPVLTGGFVSITDNTGGTYPTITNANTFGFLQIEDVSNDGSTSAVLISSPGTNSLGAADGSSSANAFDLLEQLEGTGIAALLAPVNGANAGVQNDAINPQLERERLLTHVIFSPVLKTANRTIAITYTLTVSVARST